MITRAEPYAGQDVDEETIQRLLWRFTEIRQDREIEMEPWVVAVLSPELVGQLVRVGILWILQRMPSARFRTQQSLWTSNESPRDSQPRLVFPKCLVWPSNSTIPTATACRERDLPI